MSWTVKNHDQAGGIVNHAEMSLTLRGVKMEKPSVPEIEPQALAKSIVDEPSFKNFVQLAAHREQIRRDIQTHDEADARAKESLTLAVTSESMTRARSIIQNSAIERAALQDVEKIVDSKYHESKVEAARLLKDAFYARTTELREKLYKERDQALVRICELAGDAITDLFVANHQIWLCLQTPGEDFIEQVLKELPVEPEVKPRKKAVA